MANTQKVRSAEKCALTFCASGDAFAVNNTANNANVCQRPDVQVRATRTVAAVPA